MEEGPEVAHDGWAHRHRYAATALILVWVVYGIGCDGGTHAESGHERSFRAEREAGSGESDAGLHEVEIRSGRRLGYLDQEVETPAGGEVVGIRCSTCHRNMVSGPMVARVGELTSFHSEMVVEHGDLSCNSCHASDDRDQLKLADGRRIPFERTMDLCGQCHGPQMRDYRHGAHGGMSGHWDLRQGPRERNHCVNCHDPHAPDYPSVQPAPPPRDHSMRPERGNHESDETGGAEHD